MKKVEHSKLSHSGQAMVNRVSKRFSKLVLTCLYMCCLAVFVTSFTAFSAFAAAKSPSERQAITYSVAFKTAPHMSERFLDWRSPVATFDFDIPDNGWIDHMELLISAIPDGKVSATTPLLVRFNNAEAVPIYSDGNGFDARIRLSTANLKSQGNRVRVEYQTPPGKLCLGPEHGTWVINTKDSRVIVKARTKARTPSLSDTRTYLGDPTTSPRKVVLETGETNTLQLKSLLAQGVSLNMPALPSFRSKTTGTDMKITAATRADLPKSAQAKHIMDARGAMIAVHKASGKHLVITGDTDAEVLLAARTFATQPIPPSRHTALGPTGFYGSGAFSKTRKLDPGKHRLSQLGLSQFDVAWRPLPQSLMFDVSDPAATAGKLDLRLSVNGSVGAESDLLVTLNGETLGRVSLSNGKINQVLNIPMGVLQGINNELRFTPDLVPTEQAAGCSGRLNTPSFAISARSSLTLINDYPSAATDLSRFAATGLPFTDKNGRDTTIIMATRSKAEENAALKFLAHLAKSSGSSLAEAHIIYADAASQPTTKNVLVIGSDTTHLSQILGDTPKSLSAALSLPTSGKARIMKSAQAIVPVERILSAQKPVMGGVAALYQDGTSADRFVGVISTMPGHDLTRAIDQLIQPKHWNQLEGSVARWDRNTVFMAQTAYIDPQTRAPKSKWDRFVHNSQNWVLNLETPDFGAWGAGIASKFKRKPKTPDTDAASTLIAPPLTNDKAQSPALRTQSPRPVTTASTDAYVPVPVSEAQVSGPRPDAITPEPNTSLHTLRSPNGEISAPLVYEPPSSSSSMTTGLKAVYQNTADKLSRLVDKHVTGGNLLATVKPGDSTSLLPLSILATLILLIVAICMPSGVRPR